jgi:DNA-binding FadR family transcriptional regulator
MTAVKIQRRKLADEVHDRLLERLRKGEWRPDDLLPSERELMDQFGVGRPAIREAMQTLAHAGIIEIAHGGRARVCVPTAQSLIDQIASGTQHLLRSESGTIEHLKEARVFLETGLARIAAERASTQQIAILWQRIEEQRVTLGDFDLFLDRDKAFHREIAMISGNPIFPAIVEGIFYWAREFYTAMVRVPGAERLTLAEHERIIEAIAAHDCNEAEQAMRDHLTRANVLYSVLERDSAGQLSEKMAM